MIEKLMTILDNLLIRRLIPSSEQKSDIPHGQGKIIEGKEGKSAVYKNTSGVFYELDPKCTHLGCLVDWNESKSRWTCDCHGSEFSPTGEVLKGPAKKPLKKIEDDTSDEEGSHILKIRGIHFVTHNVKEFYLEKPKGYVFTPGQATEVSINDPDWSKEKRPFTFTSLNEDLNLQFTIKGYPEHNGVTEKLHSLKPGDELIIREPWGTINYKGKGTFIAGGAGITPFIAIFRSLYKHNKLEGNSLIFSNKASKDVILEKELRHYFGRDATFILTDVDESPCPESYEVDYIDRKYLESKISDFSQNFYVCGPPKFVKDVKGYLSEMGVSSDSITFEK